jgi:choline-sulfatase
MTRSLHLAFALAALAAAAACSKDSKGDSPSTNVPGNGSPAVGGPVPEAPSRGAEFAAYSLADNRLSAHVQRDGGLLVVGASQGFSKYLRWKAEPSFAIGEKRDGQKAAVLKESTARLMLPLTKAQAQGAVRVRMKVNTPAAGRVGVRVNGHQDKEKTTNLPGGWGIVEVTIPAGAFAEGENEVLLFVGKGADLALAWLQVGGSAPAEPAPAFWDGGKKSLVMPQGGGMAWYVTVPDKALIGADLDDARCKVAVTATPDQGAPVTGTLVGRGSAVDLASLAGKPVRLDLVASGCEQARLSNAALLRPGQAPAAYSRAKGADKPKYVVFWIMDSLRADRLKVINPKARPDSPFFTSLAQNSAVFTHHYVQGNESKSSHAAMWSSLYPAVHRYFENSAKHDNPARKIDQMMKMSGFYTAGESANGYIIPRRGFGDHWDYFINHIHEETGLTGRDIYDGGIKAIDGKTQSWFLYLGTVDTHVAWKVKEPWTSKYDPEPYTGPFQQRATGDEIGKIAAGKMTVTDRDKKRIIALYDSNVSYQDALLKELFDKLTAWGIADQTMVIVTADHGDEQFEDGRVGHGQSLRETLVHVPLVIHYPKLVKAGKISQASEGIDILPTLADAVGADAAADWQGRSLLPLIANGDAGYPDAGFSSQYEDSWQITIGNWKMRYGARPFVHDISRDLLEQNEQGDKVPVAKQMLADALWIMRAHNKEWRKTRWGNVANVSPKFAADLGE